MKKLLAILLMTLMVLLLACPALAAKSANVISVNGTTLKYGTVNYTLNLKSGSSETTVKPTVKRQDSAKLTFSSSNSKIRISSYGTLTIPANFEGSTTITVTAAETANYKKTVRKYAVKITKKKANAITVDDTRIVWEDRYGWGVPYSTKSQTRKFDIRCKGGAKLTFKSSNSKIKISSNGTITVPGGCSEPTIITVTAAETAEYRKTSARFSFSAEVGRPAIKSIESPSSGTVNLTWSKPAGTSLFSLEYWTKSDKSDIVYTDYFSGTTTSKTISGLKTGIKYYFQVNAWGDESSGRRRGRGSYTKSIVVK